MTDKLMSVTGGSTDPSTELLHIEIPKQQLGSFLSGLLGQPRRTEKVSSRVFSIDHSFLCNLDSILDQRITGQQRSNLTSFNATIVFADGRSQTETSRDTFRAFNDLSLSPTTGVTIVWTYLVWFPGRSVPEKQEISLSISSDVRKDRKREIGEDFRRALRDALFDLEESRSAIRVRVSFTELTWGIDILNYIENELKKSFVEQNKLLTNARFLVRILSPFLLLSCLFFAPVLIYKLSEYITLSSTREALGRLISNTQDFEKLVNLKLDYLMAEHSSWSAHFDTRFWINFSAFVLLTASLTVFALMGPRSNLLLNEAAKTIRSRASQRAERLWYGAVIAFVVGAFAGVAGNKLTALVDRLF